MKNKYLLSIFILLCSASAFNACSDDEFLREEPKYFYTLENAFTTSEQVDQALVHCYSHIRGMRSFVDEGRSIIVLSGGNGTDMFDVPSIRHNIQFNDYSNINPERVEYKDIYTKWYQLVSYANLVLYGTSLNEIEWDSPQAKAYAIAQAKFFRAWAYRNLGEEFGGVPLVKEYCTKPRYDFVRSTRIETYDFAIEDLLSALPDLPETSDDNGRIVQGAASHCLAQLYLDKGIAEEMEGMSSEALISYTKAEQYASSLIDGRTYFLMTDRFGSRKDEDPLFYYSNDETHKTPDHTYSKAGVVIKGNVFWDLFQPGNQAYQAGNTESIWILRTDYDAWLEEDKSSRLAFSRAFCPVFRDVQSGIVDGTMEDVGGRGVCWVMPTEYARDIVYEGVWADDMRNSEAVFRRTFVGNVPGNRYYGTVVPWSVLYKEGQSESVRQAAYTQTYPISCKIQTDAYLDDDAGGNKSNLFRDDYMIRLAETFLVRAEARMRKSDFSGAATDINRVRIRSKCSHLVTADDVNLDLILDERARELIYEECRWNTLLRMGGTVAVDRIVEYAYWSYPRTSSMKQFNLWPIPQSVIDSNIYAKLEQNEGWN